MVARAVIGANFGDEGKGLVTDWLCRKHSPDVVVRFNGGAQAGHTVVTPEGQRHVFGHLGAGTFMRVPTFLSQYFVINPMLFCREITELREQMVADPIIYVHPECRVTTIADVLLNQRREKKRGFQNHGSCGIGFNETIRRHGFFPLTMRHLWGAVGRVDIRKMVEVLLDKYVPNEIGERIEASEESIDQFMLDCSYMAEVCRPAHMRDFYNPVFEGAQGLLLDRDRTEYWPNLTNSKTGIHNVLRLCEEARILTIEPYYVSRTYLTRHGKGLLPGEHSALSFPDDTNVWNEWQEGLRFAPLNYERLRERIDADMETASDSVTCHVPGLVLTHCDQYEPEGAASYYVYGETANDVYYQREHRLERADGKKVASAAS